MHWIKKFDPNGRDLAMFFPHQKEQLAEFFKSGGYEYHDGMKHQIGKLEKEGVRICFPCTVITFGQDVKLLN
jgi:hypothetical protein